MTLIGVALLLVALGILNSGAMKIKLWLDGEQLEAPGTIALWAALLSVVLKEGVYRYSMIKARQLNSPAVEANAWHHRSDALSSIGTAIGIGGAIFLGQRWTVLDPIASVVVGIFIVKVSVSLLRRGIGDLLEQSLPDAVEEEILQMVAALPGLSKPPSRPSYTKNRQPLCHRTAYPDGWQYYPSRSPRQGFGSGRDIKKPLWAGNSCGCSCGTKRRLILISLSRHSVQYP